jgi:hypothetical protein
MAITNKIENILIASVASLISIIATVLIVDFTAIKPLKDQIQKQNEVIIELAKIEKYKYEIRNDFEKIKSKESQIIINLDNKLSALQVSYDTVEVTTAKARVKFWDSLKFWKKPVPR